MQILPFRANYRDIQIRFQMILVAEFLTRAVKPQFSNHRRLSMGYSRSRKKDPDYDMVDYRIVKYSEKKLRYISLYRGISQVR